MIDTLLRSPAIHPILRIPRPFQMVAFTLVYVGTAWVGLLVPFPGEIATLAWPTSAISLAILLILGRHLLPGVILGAAVIAFVTAQPPLLFAGEVLAHSLEAILGVWLLRRIKCFNDSLANPEDVLLFGLVAGSIPIPGALIMALCVFLQSGAPLIELSLLGWHWWYGHAMSLLVITPALLLWYHQPRWPWSRLQSAELFLVVTLLLILALVVFIPVFPVGNLPLGHTFFPFILWIAVRFRPREVATLSLLVATIALIGTMLGSGPFSRSSLDLNLFLLTTFVASMMLTALLLATLLEQRRRTRDALQRSHDELEDRVLQRTAELLKINQRLQAEVQDHEKTQGDLEQAHAQAVAALTSKRHILAGISHDARTPLTVLMLYLDMLKVERYGPLNPKQAEVIDTIHANADELLRFINNLLDEAQLEANTLTLHPRLFHLQSWFAQTLDAIQPLADRKKLRLVRLMDGELPDMIYADPERLKSVIHNLVGNAIKFTRQGGVDVSIEQINSAFWRIRVTDSGPGIDEESLGCIFQPFWQDNHSTMRQINSGVGLGLSIVKGGVELMNGHIEVHSVVGEGTTFSVVLPLIIQQAGNA